MPRRQDVPDLTSANLSRPVATADNPFVVSSVPAPQLEGQADVLPALADAADAVVRLLAPRIQANRERERQIVANLATPFGLEELDKFLEGKDLSTDKKAARALRDFLHDRGLESPDQLAAVHDAMGRQAAEGAYLRVLARVRGGEFSEIEGPGEEALLAEYRRVLDEESGLPDAALRIPGVRDAFQATASSREALLVAEAATARAADVHARHAELAVTDVAFGAGGLRGLADLSTAEAQDAPAIRSEVVEILDNFVAEFGGDRVDVLARAVRSTYADLSPEERGTFLDRVRELRLGGGIALDPDNGRVPEPLANTLATLEDRLQEDLDKESEREHRAYTRDLAFATSRVERETEAAVRAALDSDAPVASLDQVAEEAARASIDRIPRTRLQHLTEEERASIVADAVDTAVTGALGAESAEDAVVDEATVRQIQDLVLSGDQVGGESLYAQLRTTEARQRAAEFLDGGAAIGVARKSQNYLDLVERLQRRDLTEIAANVGRGQELFALLRDARSRLTQAVSQAESPAEAIRVVNGEVETLRERADQLEQSLREQDARREDARSAVLTALNDGGPAAAHTSLSERWADLTSVDRTFLQDQIQRQEGTDGNLLESIIRGAEGRVERDLFAAGVTVDVDDRVAESRIAKAGTAVRNKITARFQELRAEGLSPGQIVARQGELIEAASLEHIAEVAPDAEVREDRETTLTNAYRAADRSARLGATPGLGLRGELRAAVQYRLPEAFGLPENDPLPVRFQDLALVAEEVAAGERDPSEAAQGVGSLFLSSSGDDERRGLLSLALRSAPGVVSPDLKTATIPILRSFRDDFPALERIRAVSDLDIDGIRDAIIDHKRRQIRNPNVVARPARVETAAGTFVITTTPNRTLAGHVDVTLEAPIPDDLVAGPGLVLPLGVDVETAPIARLRTLLGIPDDAASARRYLGIGKGDDLSDAIRQRARRAQQLGRLYLNN